MPTTRRTPNLLPFVPEPLQVRVVRYEPEDAAVLHGFYVTWRSGEGKYCRRCPLQLCTREEVPDSDVSNCIRVTRGESSARLAAALGLEP